MQTIIEPKQTYLMVKAGGHVQRLREVEECFLGIFRASIENDLPRILLDARDVTTELSAMDRYEFAAFVANEIYNQMLDKNTRKPYIAVVMLEHVSNSVKFGETVARNMGIEVKIIDSIEGALDWLVGEPAEGARLSN